MRSDFRIMDRVRIEVYDEHGNVEDYRETYDPSNIDHRIKMESGDTSCFADDLVTDAGLADVASMIKDRYRYISVGTGTTTTEHDDTDLEAEVIDRSIAASALATTFYTNDTVTLTGTFLPGSDYDITESGVHKESTAVNDVMFARETFDPLTCTAGRTFQVAWNIIMVR